MVNMPPMDNNWGTNGDWSALSPVKTSPVPLYYQLAEAIRERIRAGRLPPGRQLPSEREIADHAGISRMTARQALSYLVRDGALEVKPGVGTFVAAPKLTYDALHLLGFTEETMRHGGIVVSRVLEQSVTTPPPVVAAALSLSSADDVVKVVRIRSSGETPLLLETSYLPIARCRGLEHEDLGSHSLYSLLELRYGLRLDRARQTIEATIANDYESGLLHVPIGAPMLLLEGVTFTDDARPAEYFKAVYRADRVTFALESQREPSGRAESATRQVSVVLT